MPRNETTVDRITLEYHLPELPTAQHKAGLAGLVLQIRDMQMPERNLDPGDVPLLSTALENPFQTTC